MNPNAVYGYGIYGLIIYGMPLPAATPVKTDSGGGFVYQDAGYLHREEVKRKRKELEKLEQELAISEAQQQSIRDRQLDAAHAALEAMLQEEISVLRILRARLIRQIDDEEALHLILMSLPRFH